MKEPKYDPTYGGDVEDDETDDPSEGSGDPGDPGEADIVLPPLPDKRLFRVTLQRATVPGDVAIIEYVEAHSIQTPGNALLFLTYQYLGKSGDAGSFVRRGFADGVWTDFEEVFTMPSSALVN